MESDHAPLPALLRWFFAAAGLIVGFGAGLLLAPALVRPLWPCHPSTAPFSAHSI